MEGVFNVSKFRRAFVIVLDSFGVGAEPDAAEFGDGECHTLQTIVKSAKYAEHEEDGYIQYRRR